MNSTLTARLNIYERSFVWLLYGLFLLALLHHLGMHPLFQEEPRRGLIALEMLYAGDLIVPTEFGTYYYNKPPLWNWIIMLGYQLFGTNEWGVRIFSALSFFLTGLLIAGFGKRYVNERTGLYAGLFYLASVDLLFGFSVLGEIDLFYSLLTLASLLGFYHFARQDRWWLAMLLLYGLNALGVLTKGLPSFVFAGGTVLAWLAYTRQWRRLWHPAHIVGILLFVGIVGGYFYAYSLRAPLQPFLQTLLSQSSERTLADDGGDGMGQKAYRFLQHLIGFPIGKLLINALPGSLLLLWAGSKAGSNYIKKQEALAFCTLMLLVHFFPYWISPGAKARYIYMLFPLLILPGVAAWQHLHRDKDWRNTVLKGLFFLLLTLLPAGAIAIHFIKDLQVLGSSSLIGLSAFLGLSSIATLLMYLRFRALRVLLIILCLIVLRIGFNSTVAPLRASTSDAAKDKALGILLSEKTAGTPLCFYKDSRPSRTLVFYYERESGKILQQRDTIAQGAWYITDSSYHLPQATEALCKFHFRGKDYRVVRIP